MTLYDIPAPAKLNLFLHVTGRRPDGYHALQTVFRFIDLCDHLHFDLRRDGRIEREGDTLPGLAPDDDLIVRAARALQQASGTPLGAQIRCVKNIPSGAGLGGGSSDAATTLIALNRLWNTGLSRDALMVLARPWAMSSRKSHCPNAPMSCCARTAASRRPRFSRPPT